MGKPRTVVASEKRRRLTSREGAIVTSLALPRELHHRAMVTALGLNWTLAEIVREALAEWLQRHAAKGSAR
jgi:hypothetical protein